MARLMPRNTRRMSPPTVTVGQGLARTKSSQPVGWRTKVLVSCMNPPTATRSAISSSLRRRCGRRSQSGTIRPRRERPARTPQGCLDAGDRPMRFVLALALTLLGLPAAAQEGARPLTRIAFGSCAEQSRPQPIWDAVLAYRPELFVFAGDNVYGDYRGGKPVQNEAELIDSLRQAYADAARVPGLMAVKNGVRHLATWDDHDYGKNDAGAEFWGRREAQTLFADFFGLAPDDPRRSRDGVYHAETIGPPGMRVQVILLDLRFFRSPWKPTDERLAQGTLPAGRGSAKDDAGRGAVDLARRAAARACGTASRRIFGAARRRWARLRALGQFSTRAPALLRPRSRHRREGRRRALGGPPPRRPLPRDARHALSADRDHLERHQPGLFGEPGARPEPHRRGLRRREFRHCRHRLVGRFRHPLGAGHERRSGAPHEPAHRRSEPALTSPRTGPTLPRRAGRCCGARGPLRLVGAVRRS